MATLWVRQVPFTEGADVKTGDDGKTDASEKTHWQVLVESASEMTPVGACFASADGVTIPAAGSFHPLYSFLLVDTVTASRSDDNPRLFDVTVSYKTVQLQDGGDKWAIELDVDGVERTEDMHDGYSVPVSDAGVAGDGDYSQRVPVVNSVYDQFDPTLKRTFYDETISVKYNTLSVDGDQIAQLRGKVSNGNITLTVYGHTRAFASGTLKLAKAQYHTTITAGLRFWSVTLVLHWKRDGWTHKLVDRGLYYVDGEGNRKPITDDNGDPVTTPQLLNGEGALIDLPDPPDTVQPSFLGYDEEIPANLSPLLSGI